MARSGRKPKNRDVPLRPGDLKAGDERPPMEPKRQECLGRYLYGAGYYESEDNRKAIVTAVGNVSFCNECPRMQACFDEHVRLVRAAHPEESELFAAALRSAERKGISEATVQAILAKQGKPDPYLRRALENFKDGMADRERAAVR